MTSIFVVVFILLFSVNVAVADKALDIDHYLGDFSLSEGRLPTNVADIELIVNGCINRVEAYLATAPVLELAPAPVCDALRFLAFYPHSNAADLAWALSTKPKFRLQEKSPQQYSTEQQYKFATSSHVAARNILVALNDPRAVDLLTPESSWRAGKIESAIRTLAEIPGEQSRQLIASYAADSLLVDVLYATKDVSNEDERRKKNWRNSCSRSADNIQDLALRSLRRHNLAEQGLSCTFDLPDLVLDRLVEQGIAISNEEANEHFELIEAEYPFVTTDAVWHAFMKQVSNLFDALESKILRQQMTDISQELVELSALQARDLANSDQSGHEHDSDLAWRNAALATVAATLLGVEDLPLLPKNLVNLVEQELALVNAASGFAESPLTRSDIDYAAFRPRGRFSQPDSDQDWFRAMTWWGLFTWHQKGTDESRQALLLCQLLTESTTAKKSWQDLDNLLTLFFGSADDPTPLQYITVVEKVTNSKGSEALQLALGNGSIFKAVLAELKKLPKQTVNTDVLSLGPEQSRGMRLFGLRATPDSQLFQDLMSTGVWPLSGLDIASGLLGSKRAGDIRRKQLAEQSTNQNRLTKFNAVLGAAELDQSANQPIVLNTVSLNLLANLLETPKGATPALHTEAWMDKQINTTLAAWAELRHVTHLFVKEAHSYAGCSMMESDFHGYVEPYPELYAGLRKLVDHLEGTAMRCGLWTVLDVENEETYMDAWMETNSIAPLHDIDNMDVTRAERERLRQENHRTTEKQYQAQANFKMRTSRDDLVGFQELLYSLENMSRRELAGLPQTPFDCALLRSMGSKIKKFSCNRNSSPIAENPMSCVIDVALTDSECLEVGAGRPRALYVVVQTGSRRQVCRGSVSTYHEFVRPANHRLDDTQWRHIESTVSSVPWILQQPTFKLQKTITREKIAALLQVDEGQHNRIHPPSWQRRTATFPQTSGFLYGMNADPVDSDLLLAAFTEVAPPAYVVIWAHQQLVRMSTESDSVDLLQQILNSKSKGVRHLWLLQTVILGSAGHGSAALPILDEVQQEISKMDASRRDQQREYFQILMDEARSNLKN